MERPETGKPAVITEYEYNDKFHVTTAMKRAFDLDGAVLVRGLLDQKELKNVEITFTNQANVTDQAWSISDAAGGSCRLLIWFKPGDDPTGMLARSEKVAGTAEGLLGSDVFHYHTKLMMKTAKTGGKFLWHQDYGYWYTNGYLRPDLLTAFIAIDKCTTQNGCLEVLLGSHRCGRIEHVLGDGQTAAEQSRVEMIRKQFDHVNVPLNAGDCLFFHSNLLHSSQKNESDLRRWCILSAYGRTDNTSTVEVHPVDYSRVQKVGNDAIRNCTNLDFKNKDVMDPTKDNTVKLQDHN